MTYDTARGRAEAQRLDSQTIQYRISDILRRTLPVADAKDAEDGGNRGDWYRAELAVLREEADTRWEIRRKADEAARSEYLAQEAGKFRDTGGA